MNLDIPFNPEYLKILQQFIKDKVKEAGANGVVFGLSGGLDSSLVFQVCSSIFSKKKIAPLFLPESTTPKLDAEHARLISDDLGIPLQEIPINKIMSSYLKLKGLTKPDPVTLGNLKARTRMNIIYLIGNSRNLLVIGTSNKSELMLGYYTKYGDGASDIAPLGDLYKTQVIALARHVKLNEQIINKPPTAGLINGQTDEEELGFDYGIIDMILYGLERNISTSKIAEKLDLNISIVNDLKARMERNRHKRKFSKIPKIGIKTVGVDLYE
jgi:NAD+ synthase